MVNLTLVVGLATTVILGAMYLIYRKKNARPMNQNYEIHLSEQERDFNQRNIICPFCGKCSIENDRRLSCGHYCHQSCYQNRPVRNRSCSYCRDLNNEATTSSAPNGRRSSELNECSYCHMPIHSFEETSQLDCQHSAHRDCYNSLKTIFQCQACNAERYSTSSCYCHSPIQDVEGICQLSCQHSAHKECHRSFKDIMKCQDCMAENVRNIVLEPFGLIVHIRCRNRLKTL